MEKIIKNYEHQVKTEAINTKQILALRKEEDVTT